MTTIILKPRKEESLLRFHPWVFSGAIDKMIDDETREEMQPEEGDWVRVVSSRSQFLALGQYQIGSIAVRIFSFDEEEFDDEDAEPEPSLLPHAVKAVAASVMRTATQKNVLLEFLVLTVFLSFDCLIHATRTTICMEALITKNLIAFAIFPSNQLINPLSMDHANPK